MTSMLHTDDTCIACLRPVADHFDADNAFVGCEPLHPMVVHLPDGTRPVARTIADAYRLSRVAARQLQQPHEAA